MRYVIHLFILICSLIAAVVAAKSALSGESGWYGVMIAGIVFGFAAASLTLLEIRNWMRVSGHRQHSRLLRLLRAPVKHLVDPHQDEPALPNSTGDERLTGQRQALLPGSSEPLDD